MQDSLVAPSATKQGLRWACKGPVRAVCELARPSIIFKLAICVVWDLNYYFLIVVDSSWSECFVSHILYIPPDFSLFQPSLHDFIPILKIKIKKENGYTFFSNGFQPLSSLDTAPALTLTLKKISKEKKTSACVTQTSQHPFGRWVEKSMRWWCRARQWPSPLITL